MKTTSVTFPKDFYDEHLKTINDIKLTFSEINVIAYLANGWKSKDIGDCFFISSDGVDAHKTNINRKISHGVTKLTGKETHNSVIIYWKDIFLTDILCAVESGVTPVWMSEFSIDELNFSEGGVPIIHAKTCHDLLRIVQVSLKNREFNEK